MAIEGARNLIFLADLRLLLHQNESFVKQRADIGVLKLVGLFT